MESILTSIKKLLGIDSEYTQFDQDIIMHINSTFMTLNQLGVGPEAPVTITNALATWDSEFGDISSIEAIKSYTYLKVKMLFDPPTSSFVMESMNRQASEYEFRLQIQSETK